MRDIYLKDNQDYNNDVWRISDVESLNCYYGFIYTRNESKYRLKETVRPQIKGLEINYPIPKEDEDVGIEIEIDIQPGQDHLVVLRRVDDQCSYGL